MTRRVTRANARDKARDTEERKKTYVDAFQPQNKVSKPVNEIGETVKIRARDD